MSYEFKGIVKTIFDEKTVGANGFRVREFVLEDPESRYPQPIVFQVTQDSVTKLDGIKEGDTITVSFDLRGREWEGRYFVNLNAWRINLGDSSQGPAPEPGSQAGDPTMDYEPASEAGDDNLPF